MNFFPLAKWAAALAACLLSSCIDCREEIHLAADGSGRIDLTYSLPAAAARLHGGNAGVSQMLGKILSETPQLHSTTHQVTTVGDRLQIRVHAAFDSAMDLKKISASSAKALPSAATHLTGKVDLKFSGRTVDFSRIIAPGRALPGAAFMPPSSFDGRNLVYIMHLPTAPRASNATRTENHGRTLIWDFPLASAIRTPVNPRFTLEMPLPQRLIASLVALLLCVTALMIFRSRKLRKSRKPPVQAGVV